MNIIEFACILFHTKPLAIQICKKNPLNGEVWNFDSMWPQYKLWANSDMRPNPVAITDMLAILVKMKKKQKQTEMLIIISIKQNVIIMKINMAASKKQDL